MFEYKQCCVLFGSPDVIIEVSTYVATSLVLFEPPLQQQNIYNSFKKIRIILQKITIWSPNELSNSGGNV